MLTMLLSTVMILRFWTDRVTLGQKEQSDLGDNCIQNFHLRRYIVSFMVGNFVLHQHVSGAVKRNLQP